MATRDPTESVVIFRGDSTRCVLRVVSGPDAGRELEIGEEEVVVGRSATCDLQLSDRTVSDRHLVVRKRDHGLEVTDLGSSNGTHFFGTRLESAVVCPGVRLQLGSCHLDLLAKDEPPVDTVREHYGSLVGSSPVMRELFRVLARVERVEFPVLLVGETGVGKDRIAHEIHSHSKRNRGPMIVCDCTTLNVGLAESELFGHVKGAFTGALENRKGLFELADGGSIFLDEIGELPAELQAKLLRVLENAEIRPVGSSKPVPVNVRVISATHRDLHEAAHLGRFRQDLLYRLNPITVKVPSLRERREDVPALILHFMRDLAPEESMTLSAETIELLATSYDWPGNVRELRNAVMRVVALGEPPAELTARPVRAGLGEGAREDTPFSVAKRRAVDAFEREYLARKLEASGGNVSQAARSAGLDRSRFRRLLNKHGLTKP